MVRMRRERIYGEYKKPVIPTLKSMKVGQTEEWPIERMEVVRVSTANVAAMSRREGKKFRMRLGELVVEVTRIS